MEVSETDKEMMIAAELPGVDQKDIEVTVTRNELQIKGEKKSEISPRRTRKAARSTVSSDGSDLSRD